MAILIKQLGAGEVTQGSSESPLLTTNPVANGKAVIVRSIRLINKSTTVAATVDLKIYVASSNVRQLSPVSLSIPAKGMYIDSDEITLQAGHKILLSVAAATGAGPVDFVVSGVERDEA